MLPHVVSRKQANWVWWQSCPRVIGPLRRAVGPWFQVSQVGLARLYPFFFQQQ